ncbi:MAG: transposase family protein [Zoogloeaceae bacterium]|nr:transposase family protein [Zoogloeaceae bacterium]
MKLTLALSLWVPLGKETEIKGLIERFADLLDSRIEDQTAHDLRNIVAIALCAVMSGAHGRDDIEDRGRERETWLRGYLRLRNGIVGHDTLRRVFETISPMGWEIAGRMETEKRHVISSPPTDSRRLLHTMRTHRGIENGLHWCLDVTFGEDAPHLPA